MCSCGKKSNAKSYIVSYPNGGTEKVSSELAAKLKVGKFPGATYAAATAPAAK
jgi:hypothetical protein